VDPGEEHGPGSGLLLGPYRPPSNDFSPIRVWYPTVTDEADADGPELWEEPEDPWPDEPEEFDPHSLGPEIPSAPDPATGDVEVPPDLMKAFWAAVIFANVGLLGVALGPMLVYFEGMTDLGLSVFLVGVLALVFAYRRYHGYVNREDPGTDDGRHDGRDGDDAGGGD